MWETFSLMGCLDPANIYNLPMLHCFRYFQVRNFVRTYFPTFPAEPPITPLVQILKRKPHLPGCVSQIYGIIQDMVCHPMHHLKIQWGEDLNTVLTEDIQRSYKKYIRHQFVLDMD